MITSNPIKTPVYKYTVPGPRIQNQGGAFARRSSRSAFEIVSKKFNYCSVNRFHIKCNSTVILSSFTGRSCMDCEFGLRYYTHNFMIKIPSRETNIWKYQSNSMCWFLAFLTCISASVAAALQSLRTASSLISWSDNVGLKDTWIKLFWEQESIHKKEKQNSALIHVFYLQSSIGAYTWQQKINKQFLFSKWIRCSWGEGHLPLFWKSTMLQWQIFFIFRHSSNKSQWKHWGKNIQDENSHKA